jgi:two-component system, sensor histidine kinase
MQIKRIESQTDLSILIFKISIIIYFWGILVAFLCKQNQGFIINLTSLILSIIVYFSFKKDRKRLRFIINFTMLLACLNIVSNILVSGGLYSPWIYWLSIIPTIGSYFYNRYKSFFILIGVIITVLLFYFFNENKIDLKMYEIELYNKAIIISLIGLFVVYYYYNLKYNELRDTHFEILDLKNKALDKAQKELIDSQKAKDLFFGTMSHEIRTPMNAIIGITTILNSKKGNSIDEIEVMHKVLKVSSTHLLSIINDVLDVFKISDGKISVQKVPFNLDQLINTAIEIFQISANDKGLQINMHLSNDIPNLIEGDPNRILQILVNLLNNSVKFTEEGSIEVRCTLDNSNCNIEGKAINIKFEVVDTGIGMSESKIIKLFKRHEKASEVISIHNEGGIGLGLSISKMLTIVLGGVLRCKSTKYVGSNFYFTLPLAISENCELYKHESIILESIDNKNDKYPNRKIHFLLVDDNNINLMVAKKVLVSEFNESVFITAKNGKEALDQLANNYFDIILLDLKMPIMDGFETARFIRNFFINSKRNIPIIAMTASVGEGDRKEAIASGMNDIIYKPFDSNLLTRMICKLLKKQ